MSLVAALALRGLGRMRVVSFVVRMMTLVTTYSARGLGWSLGLALGSYVIYALREWAGSR